MAEGETFLQRGNDPKFHRLGCPAGMDCPHLDKLRERSLDFQKPPNGFYQKAFWALTAFILGITPKILERQPLTRADVIEIVHTQSEYMQDKALISYKLDNLNSQIVVLEKDYEDARNDVAALSAGTGIPTKSRIDQRRLQKQSAPQSKDKAPPSQIARK
jgi:hypothetical protein